MRIDATPGGRMAPSSSRGAPIPVSLEHEEAPLRLDRRKGIVVWMRAHFDGRLRVEIRDQRGGCVVLVRRGDEPMRETKMAIDPMAARDAADDLVREVFPHTCGNADCGEWVEVTPKR